MKIYYNLRSKFGVRTLSNTTILTELITQLKELGCPYGLFSSENKKGPWTRVEGVYDIK